MSAGKLSLSRPASIGMALLVLAIMAMLLFRMEDNYHIGLLLSACGLAWVGVLPFRQWTRIDWILSFITVYELFSCYWAECMAPATLPAFYAVWGWTVYILLRRILAGGSVFRFVLEGGLVPIAIALLLALGSFFVFRHSVLNAGFADTYHFRFLFRPLGYITNVWAEILLILLGWTCLARRYSALFIFLCVLAILFSFSRGAYISLGIYLLAGLLWMKTKREKIRLLVVTSAAIVLTACFLPQEMKTTLQMNRTVSQQQSTEGRIDAAHAAWNAFRERPLLGYGNGNFTYAIDHTMNQDSTHAFTSFAPNIIVQLLVEKGIWGVMFYLLLTSIVLHFIWKHRQRSECRIIGCVLLALLAKEMTQATLLCVPFTFFMLYVLLAFLQSGEVVMEEKRERKASGYILPGVAIVCFMVWNIPALQSMESTPQWVNKAIEEMALYKNDGKTEHLSEAAKALEEALERHPDDLQITYLQARLYGAKKEIGEAEIILNRLVAAYPKNSLYLVALSDAQYRQDKKELALQSFVNAVRYMPRLLTNERIRRWKQTDTLFYQNLRDRLWLLRPAPGDAPSDYARYGYIARWCDNPSADTYLRKAVAALPNLATPWRLLGDDRKYRLLLFGAFRKELDTAELPDEQELTDELMFEMAYSAKFKNWYGCKLIILQ